MMKKIYILLTAALAIAALSSCDKTNEKNSSEIDSSNYTFLDDNTRLEKFIGNDDGGFTSADGAFTIKPDEKPVITDNTIKFTFYCTNNTEYDMEADFKIYENMHINDFGCPERLEHLVLELPRPTAPLSAGHTIKYTINEDLTQTDNEGNKIWYSDRDNEIEIKYSAALYIRLPDEIMEEKYAYNEEEEIDIKYTSAPTKYNENEGEIYVTYTFDKDGNIK